MGKSANATVTATIRSRRKVEHVGTDALASVPIKKLPLKNNSVCGSARAKPSPSHKRKSAVPAAFSADALVTSARFRKTRQAQRDERSPVRRLERALVTAHQVTLAFAK